MIFKKKGVEKNLQLFEQLDDKVIQDFIKGDTSAFEKVYTTYQQYIYKLAYQFFSDQEMAKDIVQETFLKAYRYRKQLKSIKAVTVWLQRICYSCCLDIYRKKKVDSSGYSDGYMSETLDDLSSIHQPEVIQQMKLQEVKNTVVEIIDELRPEFKTIAYLRFFEELKYKEIADITGMEVESIGMYVQRTRKQIVKKLTERGYSNSSCLSIVTIPFLIDFYQEYANQMPQLSSENNVEIKKNIKNEIKKTKKLDFKYSYVLIVVSVIVAGSAIFYKSDNFMKGAAPMTEENVTIENIIYNKELTNQPLKINVITTNDNYDQILINKKQTTTVQKNGEYLIELMKNNKAVDNQKIIITNIDRDIPIVTNETYDGNQVVLSIADRDSGINYSQIEFLEHGAKSSRLKIDQNKSTITLNSNISKDNILKIPDLAGNVLNVNVSFYE